MLETRYRTIEEQVQQKVRAFRDTAGTDTVRPATDLSDDPAQEDLDFALVDLQAQTLEHIRTALARLAANEYGICNECEEEIPEKRLRAMPFATRCLNCQANAETSQLRERQTQRRAPFAAFS